MKPQIASFVVALSFFGNFAGGIGAAEAMRLVKAPALSPDGAMLAFEWNGDVWLVSSAGGTARQLTTHTARDLQPRFSPDGQTIAFLSDREGAPQVFTIPVAGGAPKQLTFHTSGYDQIDWNAKGDGLIVKATRDFAWRRGERLFAVNATPHSPETLVFDDYAADAQISPDGKSILFTREGEPWWRKGYQGSRASQIWLFDIDKQSFTKVLHKPYGCRWPMWKSDGLGFYYVEEDADGSNLFEYDFGSRVSRPLTSFKADSIAFPALARNGSAIVFRHLFDLYRYTPATKELKKLDIVHNADRSVRLADSRLLTAATDAAFSQDGLEVAFIAGGDLWVMDTELREPVAVTKTAGEEKGLLFTPDGQAILFVQSLGDRFAIARATRKDAKKTGGKTPHSSSNAWPSSPMFPVACKSVRTARKSPTFAATAISGSPISISRIRSRRYPDGILLNSPGRPMVCGSSTPATTTILTAMSGSCRRRAASRSTSRGTHSTKAHQSGRPTARWSRSPANERRRKPDRISPSSI